MAYGKARWNSSGMMSKFVQRRPLQRFLDISSFGAIWPLTMPNQQVSLVEIILVTANLQFFGGFTHDT